MGLALARIDALLTPRRGLALVFACAVLLAVPVAASASCGCLAWAHAYSDYSTVRQTTNYQMYVQGISYSHRQRIEEGILDYEKVGYVPRSFCDRYPRVCEAVKRCVAAAGPVFLYDRTVQGWSRERSGKDAAKACAIAAATVFLIA